MRPFAGAFCMGIIAGMRTFTAPVFTMFTPSHARRKLRSKNRKTFTRVVTVLAIGEMIADKLPSAAARIKPGPLFARLLSGALSAAALSKANGTGIAGGAALGGSGAALSSVFFYHLRRRLSQKTSIPDAVFGFAEDMIAISCGVAAIRTDRKRRKP